MTDGTPMPAEQTGGAELVAGFVRAIHEAAGEDRVQQFVRETGASAEMVERLSEALRSLLGEREPS